METRERYQRMSIQHNKNSGVSLPAFNDIDDPIAQQVSQKESENNVQLLKSCQGVERIFKVTHVPNNMMGAKKREQKQAEREVEELQKLDFNSIQKY